MKRLEAIACGGALAGAFVAGLGWGDLSNDMRSDHAESNTTVSDGVAKCTLRSVAQIGNTGRAAIEFYANGPAERAARLAMENRVEFSSGVTVHNPDRIDTGMEWSTYRVPDYPIGSNPHVSTVETRFNGVTCQGTFYDPHQSGDIGFVPSSFYAEEFTE